MKKQILAIIPARGGSKGIRGKNLKLLARKPLIRYTIDAAKRSRLITRIVLSSDDKKIIGYCKRQGVEVPFVRPRALAGDDTPMLKVVLHTVKFLKQKEGYVPDYVLLLQPTSPLRAARHIDEALCLLMKSSADSVVSVVPVPHNFNPFSVMKVREGYLTHFLTFNESKNLRQKKPVVFGRNGPAILACTYACIAQKKSMFGDRIIPYLMSKGESIDIDDSFDLSIAEYLIRNPGLEKH